jgi:hypothetical protein
MTKNSKRPVPVPHHHLLRPGCFHSQLGPNILKKEIRQTIKSSVFVNAKLSRRNVILQNRTVSNSLKQMIRLQGDEQKSISMLIENNLTTRSLCNIL